METEVLNRPRSRRPPSGLPSRDKLFSSPNISNLQQRNVPSSAGLNRLYRDKRYYISLIQSHMKTIRDEIQKLTKNIEERSLISANRLNEKLSFEEASATYSDQQELLGIYNTILEVQNSKTRSDKLTQETSLIKNKNKVLLEELDVLLNYKVQIEEEILNVKSEISIIDKTLQNIVATLQPDERNKYFELLNTNRTFTEAIHQLQGEIKLLKESKQQLEADIGNNPRKLQLLELLQDLNKNEMQKTALVKQMKTIVQPGEEREQLIIQVKNDKSDIEALREMKTSLENELALKQEKLDELENELNEKNIIRLKKHKELRDRNIHMTKFIDSYPERSKSVCEKKNEIQNKIIAALNQLTNSIADLNFEEVDNIHMGLNQTVLEGLRNQYVMINSRLNRLKQFQESYESEIIRTKKKKIEMQKSIRDMGDPERTRDQLIELKETTFEELVKLKAKLQSTTSAIIEAEKQQANIEEILNKNEMYGDVMTIEKRISELQERNTEISEILNITIQHDEVNAKLDQIKKLCEKRNSTLIAALKSKKPKNLEYDNYEFSHGDLLNDSAGSSKQAEILQIE